MCSPLCSTGASQLKYIGKLSKQVKLKSAYGFAKRVIDSFSGFKQLSIWFRQYDLVF